VAAPILLIVPGSLTLQAALGRRWRPQGVNFTCGAALLSVLWSAFASLALYILHVLITAYSTYLCLLAICTVLAIMAQTRLLLDRPDTGHRAASRAEAADLNESNASVMANSSDLWDTQTEDVDPPSVLTRAAYAVAAVVVGGSLLTGGALAYTHVSHPATTGYTQIAWTGSSITGDITVGSSGAKLPFEIVHQQSDTTVFRLSAAWMGASTEPLAPPVTLRIGPRKTVHGVLTIPAPPGGCIYHIVVTLAAPGLIDPLTKRLQTWSINIDVRRSAQLRQVCAL
jgi:hypothetical protein